MASESQGKWVVTWRTTDHIMLGNARNQPRRKEFASRAEAEEWLNDLKTHERDFCCQAILHESARA